jgi:hypothetical protein
MAYFVVYSVMGNTQRIEFPALTEALEDFAEKKRLDDLLMFDDRYVIGIEDDEGRRVTVQ